MKDVHKFLYLQSNEACVQDRIILCNPAACSIRRVGMHYLFRRFALSVHAYIYTRRARTSRSEFS